MDLSKYPLDKLSSFIAAIIPGSIAILIFALAKPGIFTWFVNLGFLGYNTKLTLILAVAFVIGISMTTCLNALLGGLGGVIVGFTYKHSFQYDVAPWRDPQWRKLVKEQLGTRSPNDSFMISEFMLNLRRNLISSLPEAQRVQAVNNLNAETIASRTDDANWQQWYDHYHFMIINQSGKEDFVWRVHNALRLNLETSGIYTLISAAVVPSVRHWWCMTFACVWVTLFFVEVYTEWRKAANRWLTLNDQIRYLSLTDLKKALSEQAAAAS